MFEQQHIILLILYVDHILIMGMSIKGSLTLHLGYENRVRHQESTIYLFNEEYISKIP